MGEVKPEDAASGLVERSWVRTSRRGGTLRERTFEGDHVSTAWLDETGKVKTRRRERDPERRRGARG